jgi:hypothetical protein
MIFKKIFLSVVPLVAIIGAVATYSYSWLPDQINSPSSNSLLNVSTINQIATSGPKISVTPPSYDLGIVKYEEGAKYTFKITNEGSEPLEILRLSTSCACTKATMNEGEKIIPAGGSADLFVSFDPSVHKDDSDLGEIFRVVYIKSNDSNNSEVEVEIKANVIK